MGIKYTFQDSSGVKNFESPGEYDVEIFKAEAKLSRKGDDMISLRFKDGNGCMGQDDLYFTEAASWRVDVLLKALKLTDGIEKGHECEISPQMFLGRKGRVKLDWEEYEKDGQTKRIMKVKAWIIDKPKLDSKKNTVVQDDLKY